MKVSITITKRNYERLKKLKEQLGAQSINEVISILIDTYERLNLTNLWQEIENIKKLLNKKIKL